MTDMIRVRRLRPETDADIPLPFYYDASCARITDIIKYILRDTFMNLKISDCHVLPIFRLILVGIAILIPTFPAWAISLEGNYVQGGLLIGRVNPGTPVFFRDKAIRVSPEGIFVIGFDRNEPPTAILRTDNTNHPITIARREYRIQRIDGVAPEKVEPTAPEVLERIRAESELLRNVRQRDDSRTDFAKGFTWPLVGKITGVYGSQRFFNGKPRQPHYGVDIVAPKGSPVKAPADGVVSLVRPDMFFSGGTLIIDHGHGVSSSFLHLHKILVQEGQRVGKGEVVAQVGATGRVTGAHLDWRMNWFENHIDPTLLVPEMSANPKKGKQ